MKSNANNKQPTRKTTTNARVKTKNRRKYRLSITKLLDVLLYATHHANDEATNAQRTAKNQQFPWWSSLSPMEMLAFSFACFFIKTLPLSRFYLKGSVDSTTFHLFLHKLPIITNRVRVTRHKTWKIQFSEIWILRAGTNCRAAYLSTS